MTKNPDTDVRLMIMEETIQSPEWLDWGAFIGRQQAFAVIARKCSAAQALSLKQLKDAGCHEQLNLSWHSFCPRYTGISSRHADRIISHYQEFGEAYFNLSNLARISPAEYRTLAPEVKDNCLEIDGEDVPIVPENADRIRAFLHSRKAAPSAATRTFDIREIDIRERQVIQAALAQVGPSLTALRRQQLLETASFAIAEWTRLTRSIHEINYRG